MTRRKTRGQWTTWDRANKAKEVVMKNFMYVIKSFGLIFQVTKSYGRSEQWPH